MPARQLSRSAAIFAGFVLVAVALLTADAQPLRAQSGVCDAPAAFCGRALSASCLTKLGAGSRASGAGSGAAALGPTPGSLECQQQMSSYRDCLSLVAQQCGGAATADRGRPRPADPEIMLAIWNEVKDSGDPDALNAFADEFPESPLATLARNRAAALRPEQDDKPKVDYTFSLSVDGVPVGVDGADQ